MRRVLFIAIVLLLATLAGYSFADPAFTGPTGIVTLPNAEVAGNGNLIVSGDVFFTRDAETGKDTTFNLRALYGIGSVFEVGLGFMTGNNDTWLLHGKYNTPIDLAGFDWSVGVIYADSRPPRTDLRVTQLYVVGSRMFEDTRPGAPKLRSSIGANLTEFTGLSQTHKITLDRLFIAGELFFDSGVSAGVEIQTANDSQLHENEPVWGAVIRYPINEQLTARIGWANWENFQSRHSGKAMVGADYKF